MKTIRLYHHPDCARCRRIAAIDRRLDWLDRLEVSIAIPPSGPLRMGEIAVEELKTGQTVKGADAFEHLCRNIPAYAIGRLLLLVQGFRAYIDRTLSGCEGESCAI